MTYEDNDELSAFFWLAHVRLQCQTDLYTFLSVWGVNVSK